MIEVYHFVSFSGRPFVAVFKDRHLTTTANQYQDRYYAGLEQPRYLLPVVHDMGLQAMPKSLDRMWLLAFEWMATYV